MAARENSSRAPRILIADDDQDFLRALEIWLTDYGNVEVVTATNGAEALEAIDSTVSVFLCDRRMPELTGEEVIERMKQDGYDIPTIVISAYTSDSYLHEGDVDRYLTKPITKEELFEAIEQILSD